MKNKLVWIFLVLIISAGIFFYFGKKQTPKESPFISFLDQEYNNKELVKTYDPIGNFIISAATSNTSCCGENSIDPFDEKATPTIIVSNANSPKLQSIYEISFINSGKENRGNLIHLVEAKQVNDVFVGEWSIYFGGSSGLRGLAVFKNNNGIFEPIAGYPFNIQDKENTLNLIDKVSGKKYSFPIIEDSFFTEVQDLNNDGIVDLLYADWKWDLIKEESHYQPRPWNLQVFELVGSNFRIAKWWNNGEVYRTPESMDTSEPDKNRLLKIFHEKSK